jgi:hypothetical protein
MKKIYFLLIILNVQNNGNASHPSNTELDKTLFIKRENNKEKIVNLFGDKLARGLTFLSCLGLIVITFINYLTDNVIINNFLPNEITPCKINNLIVDLPCKSCPETSIENNPLCYENKSTQAPVGFMFSILFSLLNSMMIFLNNRSTCDLLPATRIIVIFSSLLIGSLIIVGESLNVEVLAGLSGNSIGVFNREEQLLGLTMGALYISAGTFNLLNMAYLNFIDENISEYTSEYEEVNE